MVKEKENKEALEYEDSYFDFVYSINVIHHIIDPVLRDLTFREIIRVLKPSGTFFLQKINTQNFLFRSYMGYVFP